MSITWPPIQHGPPVLNRQPHTRGAKPSYRGGFLPKLYVLIRSNWYKITVNLAGLPAMSVSAGTSAEGLPLELQVVGKPFEEGTVIRVGEALT
jgi:Asp-tRNA(Asn)/Glu-tRNA(Gln) amidotransferase A subunit family amidase